MAQTDGNVITLYDIEAEEGVGPWSLNTWKARFALNYKRLHYRTVFISYPDIASKMKEIGAEPGYKGTSRGDFYTLPVIVDPKHNVIVTDSWKIAEHLDKFYPADSPEKQILPPRTKMLQRAFLQYHDNLIVDPVFDIVCMDCPASLDERGAKYFIRTRGEWWGKPLETWVTDRPAHWAKIVKAYDTLAKLFDQYHDVENGAADSWVMGGPAPTFVDFVIGGCLIWSKKLNTAPGEGWDVLGKANDGRWERFLHNLAPYMRDD